MSVTGRVGSQGRRTVIGQHKRDFHLAPYRSEWADLFLEEAERIGSALGEKALQIEHIGSTSIPGMPAKAIIDILVAVEQLAQSPDFIVPLDGLDYTYRPLDAIHGRLFFAREVQPEIRTHHLSITQKGSALWRNHLRFRDHLRHDDQLAAEYVQVKEDFAEFYARTKLVDTEWKSAFVAKVLAVARSAGADGSAA